MSNWWNAAPGELIGDRMASRIADEQDERTSGICHFCQWPLDQCACDDDYDTYPRCPDCGMEVANGEYHDTGCSLR